MTPGQGNDAQPLVQIAASAVEQIRSEYYELCARMVWFSEEMKRERRRLLIFLFRYLAHSRFFVAIKAPLINGCVISYLRFDVYVWLYQ